MVNHTKELVGKKVDREVCDVLVKSERDAFASLRDAIKDLREYNENSHKVILDEIRKSK